MASVDIEIAVGELTVISVPATNAGGQIVAGPVHLAGWSLRETTGAAVAEVEFTSGGNPVGESSMTAGGSDSRWFGMPGLAVSSDITLSVAAGSVKGAVYVTIGGLGVPALCMRTLRRGVSSG